MDYDSFLKTKTILPHFSGIEPREPHKRLFDFQRATVKWALRRGRACIFADCGLGKTLMEIEWAKQIPGRKLMLSPLAVANQTVEEGKNVGCEIKYARSQEEAGDSEFVITNYEMLDRFDLGSFAGVVLDESSILKNFDGKTRNAIISGFAKTPFRLACSATPAPNDYVELGNHAEFVGAMSRVEMLSMFFVHDGGETSVWRLKGHAQDDFWKWVCSWSMMFRKPSDIGFSDDGFDLPVLNIVQHAVEHSERGDFLFAMEAKSLQERIGARRESVEERVAKAAEIVNSSDDYWVVWCGLNSESNALAKAIEGSVELVGSESVEAKTKKLSDFASGKIRRLITKPSIGGLGMNWQHCNNMAFVGLSDSWEEYYQAVRRCWRFGQKKVVNAHIITSTAEGSVVVNIKRKEADAANMALQIIEHTKQINMENIKGTQATRNTYKRAVEFGKNFKIHLGDCVDVVREIESDIIDFSIFSPPFASLYTYSATERDMGNSRDDDEFFGHFKFLVAELFRVTKPGRLCSFHCMNLPTSKTHHGYIGIRDFRGELIRMFCEQGFIFHSEVCIWKDPVTAMQRTKALGLLHKQVVKDSCMSRQGIPDYLVTMRKPGVNQEPVTGEFDRWIGDGSFQSTGRMSIDIWQRFASPVWMDINPSRTLQKESAREEKDERHICPLQLDVIERAIEMWTNPGDVVLSPFAGIGSEGHVAILRGRRFIGAELKESYWKQAVENLRLAEAESQRDLFTISEPKDLHLSSGAAEMQ